MIKNTDDLEECPLVESRHVCQTADVSALLIRKPFCRAESNY